MKITVNKQSSIRIEGSKVIYFDPIEVSALHDADYIFITHPHWDHFSIVSILEVKNDKTVFITPRDVVEELLNIGIKEDNIFVVHPNEKLALRYMDVSTVPAYNSHHDKEHNWVGYVIKFDGITFYIAGDTDFVKELVNIKCDIALIPIGGTYTMDYQEGAELINTIKPHKVIPIHYGFAVGTVKDAFKFKALLTKDIKCDILLK